MHKEIKAMHKACEKLERSQILLIENLRKFKEDLRKFKEVMAPEQHAQSD